MKLQRHKVDNDRGEWCLSEDVAELEADNERLRAEIKCLKAPPKVLSAEEVTEPGWYWLKWGGWSWNIVRVSFYAGEIVVHSGSEVYDSPEDGLFIGPLSPPEV